MKEISKYVLCICLMITLVMMSGCRGRNAAESAIPSETQQQSSLSPQETENVETPLPTPPIEERFDLDTDEGQAMYAMEKLELWDGNISDSFDGGDGSTDNPYQIANGAQLAKLMVDSTDAVDYFDETCFVLTDDILLNDLSKWDFIDLQKNLNAEWNSSWNIWAGINFKGQFDGAGHTVYGLYNNADDENMRASCGLFGVLSGGTVSNTNIVCSIMNPCAAYVGAVVGHADRQAQIKDCSIKQTIVSSCLRTEDGTMFFREGEDSFRFINLSSMIVGATESLRIGGICGYLESTSKVSGCSVSGIVQYTEVRNRNLEIGGISGSGGSPSNCKNAALVNVKTDIESTYTSTSYPPTIYAGGICGLTFGSVAECSNSGDVSIISNDNCSTFSYMPVIRAGGIIGAFKGYTSSIINCNTDGQVSYTGDMEASASSFKGLINTSELFDYILCDGGNYLLVTKKVESVTSVIRYTGVLSNNFEWHIPLSEDAPIGGQGLSDDAYDDWSESTSDRMHYSGNGIFLDAISMSTLNGNKFYECRTFNVNDNTWRESGRVRTNSFTLHDGYIVMDDSDGSVVLMNANGDFLQTGIHCQSTHFLGQYSEGMFFSYDGFYDLSGNRIIDLSEYAGLINNRPCFFNGEAKLIAKNEAGTEFRAVIDSTGKFISEFEAV